MGVSLVVMVAGTAMTPADEVPRGDTTTTSVIASTSTTIEGTTTTSVADSPTTSVPLASTTTVEATATTAPSGDILVLTIPIGLETPSGYDRDLFPAWSDLDGDGCDTRDEVLIRDAGGTATVEGGCNVTEGLWWSMTGCGWTRPNNSASTT